MRPEPLDLPEAGAHPCLSPRDRTAERRSVLGLPVDLVEMDTLLGSVAEWIAESRATDTATQPLHSMGTERRTRQIVTLNPEMVMAARRDPTLAATIRSADVVTADGIGVVWALQLRGVRTARRLAGVDLLEAFAALAARRGYRVYLLGAAPGVAQAAAECLKARHPGLDVVGTYSGSPRREDERDTLARIRAVQPDAVFVAFGSPAQEAWIARNQAHLGAAVAIGVGGAFDFLAGRVPRAPAPLRRAGLEWLYRLWREPWRWRRMLALPRFAAAAAVESVWERKREVSFDVGRSER